MNIRKQVINRFDEYEDEVLAAYYDFLEVNPGISFDEYIDNYYQKMPQLITSTNKSYQDMSNYIQNLLIMGMLLIYYNEIIEHSTKLYLRAADKTTKANLQDTINYGKEVVELYNKNKEEFLKLSKLEINSKPVLNKIIEEANEISDIAIGSVQTQILNEMKKGPVRLQTLKNRYTDKDKFLKNIVDDMNKPLIKDGFNNIKDSRGHNLKAGNVLGSNIDSAMHMIKLSAQGKVRDNIGTNFIQVSYHDFACPLCVPFERKILIDDVFQEYDGPSKGYVMLSEAIDKGLLHKHCKHSLYSILEPLKGIEEDNTIDYTVDQKKVDRYNALRRRNYHKQKFRIYNRQYILAQDEKTRLEALRKREQYQANCKKIEDKYDF